MVIFPGELTQDNDVDVGGVLAGVYCKVKAIMMVPVRGEEPSDGGVEAEIGFVLERLGLAFSAGLVVVLTFIVDYMITVVNDLR